jgi:hypothetical protein
MTLVYNVEALGGFTSSRYIPFWLRSNQFGSIPLNSASLSFIGSIHKEYKNPEALTVDWGTSFEVRANIGQKSNINLIEGNAKLRVGIYEIKSGRMKEIMGLCDKTLSSGSFSVSGNTLGIPKIQIDIPEFYSLPMWGKLFALKASFAHGWLGNIQTDYNGNRNKVLTYFHQKSLYVRFGRPSWKWKLVGGFNHQIFWGSEKKLFGIDYTLSKAQTYFYVITGKNYANNSIKSSSIGNHLGTVDFGLEYELNNIRLLIYRQNFYDYNALKYLANISDGLNGLILLNKHSNEKMFHWNKILVECMFSKDQGKGHWTNDPAFTFENYYNNYIYANGWSYKGNGLGTPFITTSTYLREGLSTNNSGDFVNNRVLVFHLGMEGSIEKWNFVIKTSYSRNYGTYVANLRRQINQLSTYIEGNKELKNRLKIGCLAAFDAGELYYNSVGFLLRISKSF